MVEEEEADRIAFPLEVSVGELTPLFGVGAHGDSLGVATSITGNNSVHRVAIDEFHLQTITALDALNSSFIEDCFFFLLHSVAPIIPYQQFFSHTTKGADTISRAWFSKSS